MLKIGVIGAGHSGQLHIDNWKSVPGTEVIGFYEPDDTLAGLVSEKYQVPRFLHPDILLEACDAIDLAASAPARPAWCEKAIRHGKHILTANPFAQTVEEARQIIKLAEESGVKLQVECSGRFNPALLALKDIALVPSLIEVKRHLPLDNDSAAKDIMPGILIDNITLILSMVKSDVRSIAGTGVAVITEEPDVVNVRLEFHNGCVANLTCSRIATENKHSVRLFQQGAYIDIDLLNKKTGIIKLKEPEDPIAFVTDIETGTGAKTVIADQLFTEDSNELMAELEAFQKAILTNTKPVISETDGLMAIDIARQVLDKVGSNLISR